MAGDIVASVVKLTGINKYLFKCWYANWLAYNDKLKS